jgi:hypothetical protein
MSIPVSKGIGTGAAQVYSQDKTYQALQGVAARKMQLDDYNKKLEEQRRLEEKQDNAKKQAGMNNLMSSLKYNPKGMKNADIKASQKEYEEFRNKWAGRFEDVHSGGATRNEFDMEWAKFNSNIASRVDSYSQLQKVVDRMNANPSDYMEEQVDLATSLLENPDVDMSQYTGLFGKKLNIGDPNADYLKLYKDSFYADEYSSLTDAGQVAYTGDRFAPDEESFESFKGNLTPEWMEKFNVIYGTNESLPRDSSGELTKEGTEQMLRNAHDTIKANLRQDRVNVNITTPEEVEEDDSEETDFGYDTKNWNVSTVYDKDLGTNVLSVVKKSTGKPAVISGGEAIDYSIDPNDKEGTNQKVTINGVANQIWVEDGFIKAKVSGKVGGKSVMSKVVTLRPSSFQQIKTAAGIKETYESFIKKIQPSSEVGLKDNDSDPLGLFK